jgi:hypothetical protein
MKKSIFLCLMILFSISAMSQQNMVTLSGGYASANISDSSIKGTGWTINGNYEIPMDGKFSHGFSFGYINLKATEDNTNYTIGSVPFYYTPKVTLGQDKLKFFLKGALGMQFASIERAGTTTIFNDHDFGFYGGGGTGLMLYVKENIFIDAEYEIAWASNSFYKSGWISTIRGGIGFKF